MCCMIPVQKTNANWSVSHQRKIKIDPNNKQKKKKTADKSIYLFIVIK